MAQLVEGEFPGLAKTNHGLLAVPFSARKALSACFEIGSVKRPPHGKTDLTNRTMLPTDEEQRSGHNVPYGVRHQRGTRVVDRRNGDVTVTSGTGDRGELTRDGVDCQEAVR
jgi:hypothetical protein